MIKNFALLVVLFAMLTFCPFGRAQDQEPGNDLATSNDSAMSNDSVIEIARANMLAQKASIVGSAMNLNEKDAAIFWPIYRQYENERSGLDDHRMDVIKEYAQKYPNLSNTEAKGMAERMFEYDARLAQLKKKYFKKFNHELPSLTVAKFFQVERRVDLLMDMNVEASLPPLTQAQYIQKSRVGELPQQ
jgi:hypothetical protein